MTTKRNYTNDARLGTANEVLGCTFGSGRRSLDDTANWWSENRSPQQADRWEAASILALRSLETRPDRCPLIPEHKTFPFEARNHCFGVGRRKTHRIVFAIRPRDIVYVLGVYHLSRDWLSLDDIV